MSGFPWSHSSCPSTVSAPFFSSCKLHRMQTDYIHGNKTFSYVSNSALRVLSEQTFFWAMGLLVFAPVAFKPAPICIYAKGKLKTNVYSEKIFGFSKYLTTVGMKTMWEFPASTFIIPLTNVNQLNNDTYLSTECCRCKLGHYGNKSAKFPILLLLKTCMKMFLLESTRYTGWHDNRLSRGKQKTVDKDRYWATVVHFHFVPSSYVSNTRTRIRNARH